MRLAEVLLSQNMVLERIRKTNNNIVRGGITVLFPNALFYASYRPAGELGWMNDKVYSTLSFDCDSIKDVMSIPSLIDELLSYDFKVSFACVGKLIEEYPVEHKKIVNESYEIINHTYSHPISEELNNPQRFDKMPFQKQKAEITSCHNVSKTILGYEPMGFRVPHFSVQFTSSIYPILKEVGYVYSSSVLAIKAPSPGIPYVAVGRIVEFPLITCPRHPFQAFDTFHAFRSRMTKHKSEEFYQLFCEIVQFCLKKRIYLNFYFDPQDVVTFKRFKDCLELLSDKNLCVKTYGDLISKVTHKSNSLKARA